MDPNANLTDQRSIVARMLAEGSESIDTGDALRLAELQQALDDWIKRGGFLPGDWRVGKTAFSILEARITEAMSLADEALDDGKCNCDGATDAPHTCEYHQIKIALGWRGD